jgi:hypothetical protein
MAKEPVLKTGARKRMWVRVPPPPFFFPLCGVSEERRIPLMDRREPKPPGRKVSGPLMWVQLALLADLGAGRLGWDPILSVVPGASVSFCGALSGRTRDPSLDEVPIMGSNRRGQTE